jgi:phospholipase D1/2
MVRVAAAVILLSLALALWIAHAGAPLDLQEFSARMAPYRHAWYALPLVMVAFVTLGLVMVPVLLLIAATGVAFGPVLGPTYAMAGSVASAAAGFAIGRWMGRRRIEQIAGGRFERFFRMLRRNGPLAVYLVRRIPAPFAVTNIIAGASSVRFRDFLIGTMIGTGAAVIAIAGFSYHLSAAWRHPSSAAIATGALFLLVPPTLAWLINRRLRERRAA